MSKYVQNNFRFLCVFSLQGEIPLNGDSTICKGIFIFMRFDMKQIALTQGKFALVDDEDFEELNKYKWFYHKSGYAIRNIRLGVNLRSSLKMHRVIMETPYGKDTDHKDLNKLNNQKYNLRICNRSQNVMNSLPRSDNKSGYRGVYFHKITNKWAAQISNFNHKQIHLGVFLSPEEAARAYNEAAIKCYGEFARLNIIATNKP